MMASLSGKAPALPEPAGEPAEQLAGKPAPGDEPVPGDEPADEPAESKLQQIWDSVGKSAFVFGWALIVFVAARNSITWHMQNVWGASGYFWQNLWIKVYDFCNGDSFTLGLWGTVIALYGFYWLFNFVFMYWDLRGPPSWILKYKVQETKNIPVDPYRLRGVVKQVLFNQLIGVSWMYGVYRLMLLRGCSFGQELPTFQWVLWELFIMIWVEEVGFYYSHRLLHHPFFYKHIHKQHHEWTASISLVSIYAHPFEHMLSGLLPATVGPLLVGCHVATFWLWLTLVTLSVTVAHCGYHLPFFPSPEAHDWHHLKFTNNFGTLGVLDRLHGTDAAFRKSTQYQRHFMLLSFVSVKDIIPDLFSRPFVVGGKPVAKSGDEGTSCSEEEGCSDGSGAEGSRIRSGSNGMARPVTPEGPVVDHDVLGLNYFKRHFGAAAPILSWVGVVNRDGGGWVSC